MQESLKGVFPKCACNWGNLDAFTKNTIFFYYIWSTQHCEANALRTSYFSLYRTQILKCIGTTIFLRVATLRPPHHVKHVLAHAHGCNRRGLLKNLLGILICLRFINMVQNHLCFNFCHPVFDYCNKQLCCYSAGAASECYFFCFFFIITSSGRLTSISPDAKRWWSQWWSMQTYIKNAVSHSCSFEEKTPNFKVIKAFAITYKNKPIISLARFFFICAAE